MSAQFERIVVFLVLINSIAQAATPNFLLFFVDDLFYVKSWHDAGLAPSPNLNDITLQYLDIPTPNFNEIMNEGIAFKRAYSGSAMCSPSRFSLLTGRYAVRSKYAIEQTISGGDVANGVTVTVDTTKMYDIDSIYNLPKTLQNNGYITGQTGKWHLLTNDDNGNNVGCGRLGSSVHADIYNQCCDIIKQQGFDFVDAMYAGNIYKNEYFQHNPEWMVSQSQKFIQQSQQENKPFFLYFSPTLTHDPQTLDGDYTQTPKGILTGDEIPDDTTMHKRDEIMDITLNVLKDAGYDTSDEDLVQTAAAIIWIDDALGALLTYLKENGLYDNTFIVTMNDHGQEAKGTLFEHGTRVSQFVRYPPLFGNDGYILNDNFIVSNYDLASVIFDLAGINSLPSEYVMDGKNWLNDVLGEIERGDGDSNTCCNERFVDMGNSHSIVTKSHKYIFNARPLKETPLYPSALDTEQMYELMEGKSGKEIDPGEQNNLIPSDDQRVNDHINRFRGKMRTYIDENACVANDVNDCIKPDIETQTSEEKVVNSFAMDANMRNIEGLTYIDDGGGLLRNYNSLVILTAFSLLMVFNTVMILKFQFCGISQGGDKKVSDDESDESVVSDENSDDSDNSNI